MLRGRDSISSCRRRAWCVGVCLWYRMARRYVRCEQTTGRLRWLLSCVNAANARPTETSNSKKPPRLTEPWSMVPCLAKLTSVDCNSFRIERRLPTTLCAAVRHAMSDEIVTVCCARGHPLRAHPLPNSRPNRPCAGSRSNHPHVYCMCDAICLLRYGV